MAVVMSIVDGGEYVLMLTVTEVTTDVTVAVLTVVRVEIDVVVWVVIEITAEVEGVMEGERVVVIVAANEFEDGAAASNGCCAWDCACVLLTSMPTGTKMAARMRSSHSRIPAIEPQQARR